MDLEIWIFWCPDVPLDIISGSVIDTTDQESVWEEEISNTDNRAT